MQDSEENKSDEDTEFTDTPHLTYGSQDQMEPVNKQPGMKTLRTDALHLMLHHLCVS